jgi:hypothetical protein
MKMKLLLGLGLCLSAFDLLACPDFNGTYRINSAYVIQIDQIGCTSAYYNAIGDDNEIVASVKIYIDGILRESELVDGELVSRNWVENELRDLYYYKNDGTFTESITSQLPNGDLKIIKTEYRLNQKLVSGENWVKIN